MSEMKFIVFRVAPPGRTAFEVPIIFPKVMVHKDVFVHTRQLFWRDGSETTIVSAGFYQTSTGRCYGESETLKVKARGHEDESLIATHDVTGGTV